MVSKHIELAEIARLSLDELYAIKVATLALSTAACGERLDPEVEITEEGSVVNIGLYCTLPSHVPFPFDFVKKSLKMQNSLHGDRFEIELIGTRRYFNVRFPNEIRYYVMFQVQIIENPVEKETQNEILSSFIEDYLKENEAFGEDFDDFDCDEEDEDDEMI